MDAHRDSAPQTSGHLFHIDFGFIFGRDPKWNPPPMRLTREMVDAMGGVSSPNFKKFKSLCGQAYNIIRKSGNLILNLLKLMLDAGINEFHARDLMTVHNKFRLDLNDEEAERYLQMLVDQSLSALLPEIFEMGHKIAVMIK